MNAITAMIPLILRSVATRGRLIAMGLLGCLGLVIALAIRSSDSSDLVPVEFIDSFGLILVVPIVSLVVASATLGNLLEDRTMVYLWLKPVSAWQIVAAAVVAALAVVLPLVVLPLALIALLLGDGGDVGATVAAAILGCVGYTGIFTLLGVLTRRALAVGLLFILIWEGFVAGLSRTAGNFAVRTYVRSALSRISEVDIVDDPTTLARALTVIALTAIAAFAISSWRLARMDID